MTKEFSQYLKDALLIKERIQVPGLGTFSTTYKAAKLTNNNKIAPPELHIDFSEKELSADDNILNFLVNEISLPKEAAKNMIKEFLNEIKTSLSTNRSAEIHGLGKLHFDKTKKLVFSPLEHFYSENLGLEEKQLSGLTKKQQKELSKKSNKKKASKKNAAVKQTNSNEINSSAKKKRLWPVWVVLILLLLSIPIFSIYSGKRNNNNQGFVQIASEKMKSFWNDIASFSKNLKEADLLAENKDSLNTKVDSSLTNDPFVKEANSDLKDSSLVAENKQDSTINKNTNNQLTQDETTQKEEIKKPKEEHYALSTAGGTKLNASDIGPKDKLYLIAGSFRNTSNANRLKEELIDMGYQSIIVSSQNNELHRVALGKFDNLENALSVYIKFHKKRPKVAVWLLVKR